MTRYFSKKLFGWTEIDKKGYDNLMRFIEQNVTRGGPFKRFPAVARVDAPKPQKRTLIAALNGVWWELKNREGNVLFATLDIKNKKEVRRRLEAWASNRSWSIEWPEGEP